jgi:hypothetical protein
MEPTHWIVVAGICLLLVLFIRGCPKVQRPNPPGINAQLLPGVWRATHEGLDLVGTFLPDGELRWQLQPRNAWLALMSGLDLKGRWRLNGEQLTLELLETPPLLALGGENWTGKSNTARIINLTEAELKLEGSDLDFRRSLAPPEK